MNKKDRIAIIVTGIPLLFALPMLLQGHEEGFWITLPILIYWGYRFIQNDISFLKINGDD